jgi:Rieske 2Fe-2S family protein
MGLRMGFYARRRILGMRSIALEGIIPFHTPMRAKGRHRPTPQAVTDLLSSYRPGWTLPRIAYSDPSIYQTEVDTFWRTSWLFAVHSCEVAEPGKYVVVDVAGDQIIVVRRNDGTVGGLHNVCPHRGSVVAAEEGGLCRRFVCPYHQWTFDLCGQLHAAPGLGPEADLGSLALRPVHAREVAGLVFISTAPKPASFASMAETIAWPLTPQRLELGRVAHQLDYVVQANWKLLWENHTECLHCVSNHPQYVKANFDRYEADNVPPKVAEQITIAAKHGRLRWTETRLAITLTEPGFPPFPDLERGSWYSADRTALVEGWVTESLDGTQVAPLMGDLTEPDVGTIRIRSLPNFWMHGSCDHVVTTRLLPDGASRTKIRVTWLVSSGAREGIDYTLDRLLPFWQLTSEQDWLICERQQAGITSTAYRPGPLSQKREYNVNRFLQWYIGCLRRAVRTPAGSSALSSIRGYRVRLPGRSMWPVR